MAKSLVTKHIIDAVVRPNLDKSEKETLKTQLSDVFANASNINFDTAETKASLNNLAKMFKAIFSSAGITNINFDEIIKMPPASTFNELGKLAGEQFWNAFNSIKGGTDIGNSIVQDLVNQKQELQKMRDKAFKQSEVLGEYSLVTGIEKGDVKPFSLDELDKRRKGMNYNDYADSLDETFGDAVYNLEELTKGTKEWKQELVRAYKAAYELYQMRATMDEHPDLVTDKGTLKRYNYDTLADKVGGQLEIYDRDFGNMVGAQNKAYANYSKQIEQIDLQLQSIKNNNPEIINEANIKQGLKSLQEIEQAYIRIANADGKINKTKGKHIQEALGFDPKTAGDGLLALFNAYSKLPDDSPWEVEYQALLKYVRLYESYLKSDNKTHVDATKDPKYRELYERLQPMAEGAEMSLQNLLNHKPSKTGKGSKADVVSPEDASEAERIAEAKIKGAEADEKSRKEKDAAAAAAERGQLAQEATTKAAVKEAEAVERTAKAKDAMLSKAMLTYQDEFSKTKADRETAAYVNTNTGDMSDMIVGGVHGIEFPAGTRQKMAQLYDMEVHSHNFKTAAPSVDDLQGWIESLQHISKYAIRAGKELLAFDFSSLKDGDAEQIIQRYKAVNDEVNNLVHQLGHKGLVEKFGEGGAVEGIQSMMRQGLDEIMKGFPGVMKSISMPELPVRENAGVYKANADALNAEIQAQKKLNDAENQNPPAQDDSGVHNTNVEAIEKEIAAETRLSKVRKAVRSLWDSSKRFTLSKTGASNGNVPGDTGAGTGITAPPQVTNANIPAELQAYEALKGKIAEVTAAVQTKTQAFFAEQSAVKRVAQSEAHALGEVEKKVIAVRTALNNIKTGADIGAGLSNISINVNHAQSATQNVDNALATENTLISIKTVLDAINGKITNGGSAKRYSGSTEKIHDDYKATTKEDYRGSGYSPEKSKTKETDAVRAEQLKTLKELIKGYEKLGKLQAKYDSTGDLKAREEAEQLKKELEAKRRSTRSWITVGQDNSLDKARGKAYDKEFLTSYASKEDKEKLQLSRELEQSYKHLGELQAERDHAKEGTHERKVLEEKIKKLQQEIELKQKIVNIDKEYSSKITSGAYAAKKDALSLADAKRADKEADKKEKNDWNKLVAESRQKAGLNKATSAYETGDTLLRTAASADNITPENIAKLQQYQAELQKLEIIRDKVKNSPDIVSPADQEALKSQTFNVKQMTSEMKGMIEQHNALQAENAQPIGQNMLSASAGWEEYKNQLINAVTASTTARISIKGFDSATNTLTYTVKTGANEFTNYKATMDRLSGSLVAVRGQTVKTMGVIESISKKIKEFSYYFTGSMMIYRVIGMFRQGITYVKEIDTALVELKKVTDATEESYDRFVNTAAKLGGTIGSTITDVTKATATFAKLGYQMEMATQMAEAALVYQNVGDNVENADAAAESIISTLKGFGLEASQTMSIVDKFNEVGNNFSITSTGIGEALKRSASALSEAGNSLDESIALITAANEVVQDPEAVGTALKTLTLRLRGAKTELEEAGLDAEGMIETTSTLQKKLLALTGGKVDIMLDADTFKSSTEILREMSEVWEDMSDIEQASALEMMGGKRQANILSSIIQNFDTVEDVIESSANSAGSALRENEKILDSVTGKMKQFSNEIQAMWASWLDADWFKGFIDVGTWLISKLKDFGMFKTILLGISGAIMVMNKMGPITFVKSLYGSLVNFNTKLSLLPTTLMGAIKSIFSLNAAMDGLTVGSFKQTMSLVGLETEQQNAILTTMGLSEADETAAISKKKLNLTTLEQMAKEGQLTAQQATQLAIKYGLISATTSMNAAQAMETLTALGLDDATRANIISTLGLTESTRELTAAEILDALAKAGVKDEALMAAIAQQLLGKSTDSLTFSFKKSAKAVGGFLKSMAPMLAIAAVVGVITLIKKAIDDATETMEEMQTAFDDVANELSATEQELKELGNQLEDVNSKIDELQSKDNLSFTEVEELERLKNQNNELERQIDLKEQLKKQQQLKVNSDAVELANEYENIGINSGKTTAEVSAQWGKNAGTGGAVVGGVAGAIGGSIAAGALAGTKVGGLIGSALGPIGTIIGAALGAIIVGGAVAFVGSNIGEAVAENEPKVGESLDNMREQYMKLEQEYKVAQNAYHADPTEKNKEKFEEAQEAFDTYKSSMAEYLNDMNAIYSQMDWETATPQQRQEMQEFYDAQDTWAIQSGSANSKTNAISRIFGKEASDDIKYLKKDIEDAMAAAKRDGTEPTFDFRAGIEGVDGLKNRLYDLGLSVTDVKYYFLDLAKAEKEAEDSYSVYDTVKEINSLSGGVKSLKGAFAEIQEEGYVSTETLVELEETFGGLGDAWEGFVDTVATGTGSIQEATEAINELLEAYLMEQLSQGPMGAEEKLRTIMLLQQMGVKNAKEYVDAMQQTSMASEVASRFNTDQKRIKELEAKKKKNGGKGRTDDEIALQEELEKKTIDDYIADVEKDYKIDLDIEDERLIIEKAITAEKARQAALDAEANKVAYDTAQKNKDTAQDKADEAQKKLDKVNKAYKELKETNRVSQVNNASVGIQQKVTHMGKGKDSWDKITYYYKGEEYGSAGDAYRAAQKDLEAERDKYQKEADGITLPMKVTDVDVQNAQYAVDNAEADLQKAFDDIGLSVDVQLTDFNTDIDGIQSAYDTLTETVKQYNKNGYLTLDNLQALLSLQPEYLACLQMENGQLSINQQAMEAMIQAKLAEAKATVVQQAMHQLNALATREEKLAIEGSTDAASGAISGLGAYGDALSDVAQNAIVAAGAVSAFQDAVKGANSNEFVTADEISTVISNMNTQLEMIDSLGANLSTNFSSIVSPSSSSDEDSAFDKLEKTYDHKVSNLENKQTYLENQIDKLEKEGKGVSKSYYEELIAIEEEKLSLHEKQRTELTALLNSTAKGTDDWYEISDALWETEHAIQESTLRMVEFRQSIVDLYKTAFDDIGEAYGNKGQLYDDREAYVQGYMDIEETKGNIAPLSGYKELISINKDKQANAAQTIKDLNQAMQEGLDSGYLQEHPEILAEMSASIRQNEKDWQDATKAIAENEQAIQEWYSNGMSKVSDAHDNMDDFYGGQNDYIESYMELLELNGEVVPVNYYKDLIANEEKSIANKKAENDFLRSEIENLEVGSDKWNEHTQKIRENESAILDSEKAIAQRKKEEQEWYSNAMSKVSEAYDDKSDLYSRRSQYIQSDMELRELNGEMVPLSHYQALINNDTQDITSKMEENAFLESELANLEEGSEEWKQHTKKIQDNEQAIMDNSIAIAKNEKAMQQWYSNGMSKISEAYDNANDLYERRNQYIETYMELLELEDEAVSVGYYKDLIANEEQSIANKKAENKILKSEIGNLEEGSEEWLEQNQKINDNEQAILDSTVAAKQYNKELKQLYITAWDKVRQAFENRDTYYGNQQDYIDSYISRLENLNIDVPDEVYDKLIEIQNLRNESNQEDYTSALTELEDIEEQYGADSQEYFDKYNEVVALEKDVYDGKTKVIEYEQKIIEKQFEKFDRFIDRMNDSLGELKNISGLISDDDVALEDGTWSKEGITSLGLLVHQMEINKGLAQEYGEEIKKLTEQYENGEISANTYYERLQTLKDGQWDAINAYKEAEDSIIDLNEARIDVIEEGINKEIEAYQELIDMKKSELDAERDLYDFRNNIKKQTKDIASLERRIASMSGSSDAATIAERTRLEAELREAKDALNDSYYDHSMNSQSQALDDEMKFFDKSKMDYLEQLRETLKDIDSVMQATLQNVKLNSDVVFETMNTLSSEYGFQIEEGLKKPWESAAEAAINFKDTLELNDLLNEDNIITLFHTEGKIDFVTPFTSGSSAASAFQTDTINALKAILNGDGDTNMTIFSEEVTKFLKDPFTSSYGEASVWATNVNTQLYNTHMAAGGTSTLLDGYLSTPWTNITAEGSPMMTFSEKVGEQLNGAIIKAQEDYKTTMETEVNAPYKNTEDDENSPLNLFDDKVGEVYANAIKNITDQYEAAKTAIDQPWRDATADDSPLSLFDDKVWQVYNDAIWNITSQYQSAKNATEAPWKDATGEDSPLMTFSQKVWQAYNDSIWSITSQYNNAKNAIDKPWLDAVADGSPLHTFYDKATGWLDEVIQKAKETSTAINTTANTSTPDYDGGEYKGDDAYSNNIEGGGNNYKKGKEVKELQKFLNTVFDAKLTVDGSYGPKTIEAVKDAQRTVNNALSASYKVDGMFGDETRNAFLTFANYLIDCYRNSGTGSSMYGQGIQKIEDAKKKLPAAMYSKGTLGTKRDQFAITDESWIGEEITLAAGRNGQLQYLKKGSAVMPADISANLVEWGKINPSAMNLPDNGNNLNMINNAVIKPELNISFDSMVHVDNCSQDTLKDLEKMVDIKIDQFSKQMNYAIKRFK